MSTQLPEPIIEAVNNNEFNPFPDGYSYYRLVEPPQMTELKREYRTQQDFEDKTWLLMKRSIIHKIAMSDPTASMYKSAQVLIRALNKAATKDLSTNAASPEAAHKKRTAIAIKEFVEQHYPLDESNYMIDKQIGLDFTITLKMPFKGDTEFTRTVFDTIDLFDKRFGTLYLFRFQTVASFRNPSSLSTANNQASIQKYLLTKSGYDVKECKVIIIYKDYNTHIKKNSRTYPAAQMTESHVSTYKMDKVEEYILNKIKDRVKAERGENIPCSNVDRWKEADTISIVRFNASTGYKQTVKKGLRTVEAAQHWMMEHPTLSNGCTVEVVRGDSVRCRDYCPVAQHCPQYKQEMNSQKTTII